MRINKKVAAASVASAFVFGGTLVLPGMAGAQDTTTTSSSTTSSSTTSSSTSTSTTLPEPVNTTTEIMLACTSDPDFTVVVGPLNIPLTVSIDSLISGDVGDTIPFTGAWTLTLPPGLAKFAADATITEIGVENFGLSASTNGGLSGGPFAASPTNFSIPTAPPANYTGSLDGSITVTEAAGGTLTIASPFTMNIVVTPPPPTPPIPLSATCVPDVTQVLQINDGWTPPFPPTTPSTPTSSTTTTGTNPAPKTNPRFTG